MHSSRLTNPPGLKEDRVMPHTPAIALLISTALRGRASVAAVSNNNRNNASLPRAGD